MRLFLFANLCLLASVAAVALPPCLPNSQFKNVENLYHEVAIIGPDDREARSASSVAANIEAAQGRAYCLKVPYKSGVPTKEYLVKNGSAANATLSFENDIAIVSRHVFKNQDGSKNYGAANCYFEHVQSGEIIPFVDAAYPKFKAGDFLDWLDSDFAVVRLKSSPKRGKAIPEEDIIEDLEDDRDARVKVISNYARNSKGGKEALTMTSCYRGGRYQFPDNSLSNVNATDCDTGLGSSGAQAYLEINGKPKWFGIISGEITKAPEGGEMDPRKLSTYLTRFDSRLFQAYQQLKQRQAI
ncbi:MAG: hypothetical protein KF799_15590 [Bdellovibrionales bacterium]|nr:hypothetical protein [Bdellovibrionales bacterium]